METKVNQDTLLIGCFYRPPDARVGYWDLIDDSLNKAGRTPHKLLILGDFNTDINLVPSRHLSRIMHLNNLVQIIKEPTRYTDNSATLIDLILTTFPDLVQLSGVLPPVHSDHCCPFIKTKCNVSKNASFKRTIYNYRKLDIDRFKDILRSIDWNETISKDCIDEAAESLTNKLLNTAKQCMPSKKVKNRDSDAPWMTEEIRKLIGKKLIIH